MTKQTPKYKTYDAETYAENYAANLNFEQHLIDARHECCRDFLLSKRPHSVLEVGCGPSLIVESMGSDFDFITEWDVVEASNAYGEPALERIGRTTAFGARYTMTIGYFEDVVGPLIDNRVNGYDAVLLSGLLHETSRPDLMIAAAKSALKRYGWLYILVPNASSFHRLLAWKLGLVDHPAAISERNVLFGQNVVYTPETLREFIARQGELGDFEVYGHTLKLFTNDQMAQIIELFGEEFVPALAALGKEFPENAAEFALIARRR